MKKKFVVLLAGCMILASTSMAMAVGVNGWGLDLSSIGGGTYTNLDRLDISGQALVTQDMPLVVGAAFTETGNLGVVKGYFEPGGFAQGFNVNSGIYNLYFNASGLAGTITSVSATGYTYGFTPGVGLISLVADTDLNFSNGLGTGTTLATFTVTAPSGGTNVGFLGGLGPNGTTDLTGSFASVANGVFSWNGMDFASLPAGMLAFGLTNTNNQIDSLIPGDPTIADIHSAGQFGVNVVPEPGTFALLGVGLFGLVVAAKRRSKV